MQPVPPVSQWHAGFSWPPITWAVVSTTTRPALTSPWRKPGNALSLPGLIEYAPQCPPVSGCRTPSCLRAGSVRSAGQGRQPGSATANVIIEGRAVSVSAPNQPAGMAASGPIRVGAQVIPNAPGVQAARSLGRAVGLGESGGLSGGRRSVQ